MKYLKKFNEAIVDYKSDDIDALMAEINTYPNNHRFQLSQLSEIGSEYNVEFVDYNTFLNDLSERDKSTAPPRTSQFFALVNRVNNKIRIVLNLPMPFIPKDFFNQVPIGDILKHEQIHTIQYSKRPFETPLPEPKDKKQYFSDKDEVMAFSFSIAKEIYTKYNKITTPKEGIDRLINGSGIRLYDDIRKSVDDKTLKRYHKYIYLYLEDLLKPEEIKESMEHLLPLIVLWINREKLSRRFFLNNIKENTLDLVKFLNLMGYHIDVDVLDYKLQELIDKAFTKKEDK